MIKSLQSIRFILALMIFIHHFFSPQIEQFGAFPVVLFFMLSGFMITMGYSDRFQKAEISYLGFIRKRLIRIYPLNWVTLVLALFVPIDWHLNVNYYIAHLPNFLLLQSWIPVESSYFSGNAPAWFLSDILFCYLAFPFVLKILSSKYRHFIVIVALSIYAVVASVISENWVHPLIYINPMFRIIDFCLGVYGCLLWKSVSHERTTSYCVNSLIEVSACVVTAIFIMIYPYVDSRYALVSLFWIPSILMILAFVNSKTGGGILSNMLSYQFFTYLGSISFSFYMFHLIVIHWNRDISNGTIFENNSILGAFLCISVTLLLSHIYSCYLEPRFVQYLNKK